MSPRWGWKEVGKEVSGGCREGMVGVAHPWALKGMEGG